MAYFPTASLSYREKSTLNFGATPLRYPVDGYMPLQHAPPSHKLRKAEYLLGCLEKLLYHVIISADTTTSPSSPSSSSSFCKFVLPQEDVVIMAARVFEHLGELLKDQYIVAHAFVPFMIRMLEDNADQQEEKIQAHCRYDGQKAITRLLDLMFVCMEVPRALP